MLGSQKQFQTLLRRLGVYERARALWVYEWYLKLAKKHIAEERRKETEFYAKLLQGFRRGDLIFDIGANHGDKSRIFLLLGARVIAVEPDEKSLNILKERFVKYRLTKLPFIVVPKAASDKSSVRTLFVNAPGSALNTLNEKWAETLRKDKARFKEDLNFGQSKQVETVSIVELTAVHGSPFFIKIDVEGHELNVLRGMQQAVPYVSFEVNLPEFRTEGLECINVLQCLSADGRFNYATDCQRGLILKNWVRAEQFLEILKGCGESAVEVFWKTSGSRG